MQVNHTKTIDLIDFEEHIAKILYPTKHSQVATDLVRTEATSYFWNRSPANDTYINAWWDEELALEDCNKTQETVITELSKLGLVAHMEKDEGKTYPVLEEFLWEICW